VIGNAANVTRILTSETENSSPTDAEFARELEAWRTGIYRLTDSARTAIQKSRASVYAPTQEMDDYWKRHDIG
jgi:hypothetical protein